MGTEAGFGVGEISLPSNGCFSILSILLPVLSVVPAITHLGPAEYKKQPGTNEVYSAFGLPQQGGQKAKTYG